MHKLTLIIILVLGTIGCLKVERFFWDTPEGHIVRELLLIRHQKVNTEPISLTSDKTIKAIACKDGKNPSQVIEQTYSIRYTIGGTITGLQSGFIVLKNNNIETTIFSTGSYSLEGNFSLEDLYNVSIHNTPTLYNCTINNASGSVTGIIDNINIHCTLLPNCYPWGCFSDNGNNTITLDVIDGTFGGQNYTSQTLTFAKCSHGQTTPTCSGTPWTLTYCNSSGNYCNGGTNTGILNPPDSSSPAWNACNGLNLGGKTGWRVPTKNELKLLIHCNNRTMPNDTNNCGTDNSTSPTINSFFPNTPGAGYWSASSRNATDAWIVVFGTGNVIGHGKTNPLHVRCVTDE